MAAVLVTVAEMAVEVAVAVAVAATVKVAVTEKCFSHTRASP